MGDFKKKIMDILFDDPSDISTEEVLNVPKESQKKSTVKATDILYGKEETSIMDFLNSNNTTEYKKEALNKPINKPEQKKETYSYIENVSPIFGNVNKTEEKAFVQPVKEEPKEEPKYYGFGDFTGVVISPIFGFDSVKANEARKVMDFNEEEIDITDELKENIQEEDNLFYEEPIQENLFEEPIKEETINEEPIEVKNEENEMFFAKREHEDTEEISFGAAFNDKLTSDEELLDNTYDFNDLKSDDDKDLFDELIGDDD